MINTTIALEIFKQENNYSCSQGGYKAYFQFYFRNCDHYNCNTKKMKNVI